MIDHLRVLSYPRVSVLLELFIHAQGPYYKVAFV